MLSFDSVKLRLDREQSLSFLEFNYMILQAYDFVELNRATAAAADGRLRPVGQHHQRHRSRPPHGHPQLYALTSPLLTTSSGAKMGKTATGAVWLNPRCAAL
jgi:tyrosyl-tRNA synthetase